MDDLFNQLVLLPSLIATLPGLWACHRKQFALGIFLVCIALVLVVPLAFMMAMMAVTSKGSFPGHFVTWGVVALFCSVAAGMVIAARTKGDKPLD